MIHKMKQVDAFENKHLTTEVVKNVCNDMQRDRTEMLSIRNCTLSDKDFKKLCKSIGVCRSIRHLALTVNIICDGFRVQVLAQGLQKNTSLVGLHLHGNVITDNDMKSLYPYFHNGNRLTVLDLSEGRIGDEGLDVIGSLLKENKGLQELTLSHNPNITKDGWARFGMAISSGTGLRTLEIDYNELGDTVACCLATALPGAPYLEYLDFECTRITDKTAQVLLHLVKSYNSKLKKINMKRNHVTKSTIEAIKLQLSSNSNSNCVMIDDDEGSLATSEPPIGKNDEYMHHSTPDHHSSFEKTVFADREIEDLDCVPVVEVSPACKTEDTFDANVAKNCRINESTRSMAAMNLNQKDQIRPGFVVKRAFSLTDLRQSESNKELLSNELETFTGRYEEYEAYIPEKDKLRDETSMFMAVEDIEQEDDVDIKSANVESLSPHSIKGYDETDDTSKSGDQSPAFYVRQESEPSASDVDTKIDNLSCKQNKSLAVTSIESIVQGRNDLECNKTTNEIVVRPFNPAENTTTGDKMYSEVEAIPLVLLASKVNGADTCSRGKETSSVPLASKVNSVDIPVSRTEMPSVPLSIKVNSVDIPVSRTEKPPVPLSTKVNSVDLPGSRIEKTSAPLSSKVNSVDLPVSRIEMPSVPLSIKVNSVDIPVSRLEKPSAPLSTKVNSVDLPGGLTENTSVQLSPKVNRVDTHGGLIENPAVPLSSKVTSGDAYDSNQDKPTPSSMTTDSNQENKDDSDFGRGDNLPKLNRRRGKRKGTGVDLAAAIRQKRQSDLKGTDTMTDA